VVHHYLEVFLNIPKKPDARFLRGTGVDCEEESETTDWETDKVELDDLGSTLTGDTSVAVPRFSTTVDVRAGFGGDLIAGNRSLWWV
jgi:hypothetical protein